MNTLRIAMIAALVQGEATQRNTTASIEGVVVDAATGRPIPRATVELTGIADTRDWSVLSLSAVTSDDGKFAMNDVSPGGAYQLVASRTPDYAAAAYGQSRPDDPWVSISLIAGQRITGLRVTLREQSSISGRILDKDGKAVRGVSVSALEVQYRDRQRVLQSSRRSISDERGQYRIAGLASGRYVVRIGPVKGSLPVAKIPLSESVSPYIYFPAVINPDNSVTFEVPEGGHIDGVNFQVIPILTRRVRGAVANETTGQDVREARVFLVPLSLSPDSTVVREFSSRNGEFDFRGVPPGAYQIFAITEEGGATLSGRISVNVDDSNLRNVKLAVRPDAEVSGRLFIDGPAPKEAIDFSQTSVSVYAESRGTVDGSLHDVFPSNRSTPVIPSFRLTPDRDGTFTLKGVRSWSYFVDVDLTGNSLAQANVSESIRQLYVKTIRVGSTNLLHDGQPLDLAAWGSLEIVLGTDSGILEGRILDESKNSIAHSVVVLVPDGSLGVSRHLYRFTKADASGRFSLQAVAPGAYKVFAWRSVETGAWFVPEVLRSHQNQAVPVMIVPSSRTYVEAPPLATFPGNP